MATSDNKRTFVDQVGNAVPISPAARKALADVMDWAKRYYELAAKVSGYVSAVTAFAELAGILEKENEFDRLYERLAEEFKALAAKIDALSKQVLSIELGRIKADTDATNAAIANWVNYHKAHGIDPPVGSLEWEQLIGAFSDESAANAAFILQDTLWLHTMDARDVCNLEWGKQNYGPPPSGDYVWDYRLTLPIMLAVFQSRFLYLSATDPNFLAPGLAARDELSAFRDALLAHHARILTAFTLVPAPGPRRPAPPPFYQRLPGRYEPLKEQIFEDSYWSKVGAPCGAVDRIAGFALIEKSPLTVPTRHDYYQDFEAFLDATNLPQSSQPMPHVIEEARRHFEAQRIADEALASEEADALRRFWLIFLIRAKRQSIELYRSTGLGALIGAADNFSRILNDAERPNFSLHYAGFHSLRAAMRPSDVDVAQIRGDAPLQGTKAEFTSIESVRELADILGRAFANVPMEGPPLLAWYSRVVSLRRILAGD